MTVSHSVSSSLGSGSDVWSSYFDREVWCCYRGDKTPVDRRSNRWVGTYADKLAQARTLPDAEVGIYLPAAGLACVDLDGAIDDKGVLHDWASEVLDCFPQSLVTRSRSGRGLHLWISADGVKSRKQSLGSDHTAIELFTKQYICLRMDDVYRSGVIESCPDGLVKLGLLMDRLGNKTKKSKESTARATVSHNLRLMSPNDLDNDYRLAHEMLSRLDPDMGYNEWLEVGMALHAKSSGASEWLALWDHWSSGGSKYVQSECRTKWDGFRSGGGGITFATLVQRYNHLRPSDTSFPIVTAIGGSEASGMAETSEPSGSISGGRQQVMVSCPNDDYEVLRVIYQHLRASDRIWWYGSGLSVVTHTPGSHNGEYSVTDLTPTALRSLISQICEVWTVRATKDGESVSVRAILRNDCLAAMVIGMQSMSWPVLSMIVDSPMMGISGEIAMTAGLHVSDGLLVSRHLPEIQYVHNPTREDALTAYESLIALYQDIPISDQHKAAVVALSVTGMMRSAINGIVPAWLITGNQRRGGKTLLAELSMIAATCWTSVPKTTWVHDREELRKTLLSMANAQGGYCLWDNAPDGSVVGSDLIDMAITSRTISGRALGSTTGGSWMSLRWDKILCWTGNNLAVSDDLLPRMISVYLSVDVEDAAKRTDFAIPDIAGHIRKHASTYAGYVATLARFCWLNQADNTLPPKGGFEAWSRIVRYPLYCLTGHDIDQQTDNTPISIKQVTEDRMWEAFEHFQTWFYDKNLGDPKKGWTASDVARQIIAETNKHKAMTANGFDTHVSPDWYEQFAEAMHVNSELNVMCSVLGVKINRIANQRRNGRKLHKRILKGYPRWHFE